MLPTALFDLFNSITPMSPPLEEKLLKLLKERRVRKKTILLNTDSVCNHMYFIVQGLFRGYHTIVDFKKKKDVDVCTWFMKEGDILISPYSFFARQPSYESIQALEDSVIFYLTYDELQGLYAQFPEFNLIGRVLTERYHLQSDIRLYYIRMRPASDRYMYFEKYHLDLINRLTRDQVASYLDMSRESLHKVRAFLRDERNKANQEYLERQAE